MWCIIVPWRELNPGCEPTIFDSVECKFPNIALAAQRMKIEMLLIGYTLE
jgi:hypothetical protein